MCSEPKWTREEVERRGKSWEEKQALVPRYFRCFSPYFMLTTPPSSCPSTLAPPLTLHSFFYSPAAFPLWPESTIVVRFCFFLSHDCVCQHVYTLCACWIICAFTHVTVHDPVMMSCIRNGETSGHCICNQCGSLKSPEWPDKMVTCIYSMCVLLFLNCLSPQLTCHSLMPLGRKQKNNIRFSRILWFRHDPNGPVRKRKDKKVNKLDSWINNF